MSEENKNKRVAEDVPPKSIIGGNNCPKTKTSATKTSQSPQSSIRLEVQLFEPNANSFPEFNFLHLINAEKKKRKKIKKLNGFQNDQLEDPPVDDDEVAQIARQLEEKYGAGSSYAKKCSKRSTVDYYDKGAGYDENDSFIDNTEAYDELIPDEVEPNHGGFYINSGPLEFQHLSNYERPDDAIRMPKPRKRTLSTSSESSGDEKKKKGKTVNGQSNHPDQCSQIEKKMKPGEPKPKSLPEKQKESKTVKDNKPTTNTVEDKVESVPKPEQPERTGSLKTTTVKDMLRLKRDNHRHMQESKISPHKSGKPETVRLSSTSSDSDSSGELKSMESSNGALSIKSSSEKPKVFELPQNISVELMQNLVIIEQSSRYLTTDRENILSNASILEMLSKIEVQIKGEKESYRDQIYSYLELKLNCPKEKLIAKAIKLTEETKVKKGLVKLRRIIETAMPKIVEDYENRVRSFKNTMNVIGISSDKQDLQMPRKVFQFSEAIRNCLYDVFLSKKNNLNMLKHKNENSEEHLSNFLRQDVLPLWPSGWVNYEDLITEIEKRKLVNKKQKDVIAKKQSLNSNGGNIVTITPIVDCDKEALSLETKMTSVSLQRPPIASVSCDKTGVIQSASSSSGQASAKPQTSIVAHSNQLPINSSQDTSPNSVLKKNSYDYSISNLIGAQATNTITSYPTSAIVQPSLLSPTPQPDLSNGSGGGGVIKIRSVANLNSSLTKANPPTIDCEELSSDDGGGKASDSSCEIVGVFNKSNKKEPSAKKIRLKNYPEEPMIPQSTTVMDTNDIDVNQIMKDLKELQQWESGNFGSKKGDFVDRGKAKKRPKIETEIIQ